ncbi:hypothetical protein TNCV_287161 [Trichonephila clavipes]|nr:hypothetical protein TNCV_287161 [Trichonephila clavipes]
MSLFIKRISWRGCEPLSQQPMTRCFQWVTNLKIPQTKVTIEYPVQRERSKHDVQHIVLHYVVGRWCLAGLEDRTQPRMQDVRNASICVTVDPN